MAVDSAIADLKKLLTKDPNDTRALVRLAEQHVKGRETAVACGHYRRAAEVLAQQGFARRAISAFAQALECARAQVATHDRVAPIARAMAALYVKEKLPYEAVATLDHAARFLVERGADIPAALVLEERLAVADADAPRVMLAEALIRLGEVDRAVVELTGVFLRLRASGARDEAIDVGEKVLLHRKEVPIARACAEMYLARNRNGDPFLALAKLRVCCTSDATHVPTLELLARAFDQAKHPDKAARVRAEIAAVLRKDEPLPALKRDDSAARMVDAGWDDIEVETDDDEHDDAPRIDVGRPSFWQVPDDGRGSTEASVVSVSLTDIELVDGAAPKGVDPVTLLETALEHVDSLATEGRLEEASLLLARHLQVRPSNPLLLERKRELDAMSPPPRLRPRTEESVTGMLTMTA